MINFTVNVRHILMYASGRVIRGMWNGPGLTPDTAAWNKSTEGLVHACIETKTIDDAPVTSIAASIDGADFRLFKWECGAIVNVGSKVTQTPVTTIIGLRLCTRDCDVVVYRNGQIKVFGITREEQLAHYTAFGR